LNFRYPIFLDLAGKKCLVTGEGYEVPQKLQALVDASANVVYVNPRADSTIEALFEAGLIRWEKRDFEPQDLDGCFLVITDREDNSDIFRLAEEQRILCNAVDDPPNCRFSFGSVHRQGDLTVAISTNGWAPAMAVRLREKLEREVGLEYGTFLELLKAVRPEITSRIAEFSARRELWYRIVDSDVLELLRNDQLKPATAKVRQMIEDAVSSTSRSDTSAVEGDH
jgi:precorrin-2 dehydrogenase / sirohydrochlorin ferrochelatase